jgi:NADPH:quinone reductase-like Zn-dependent oxidoreductase
MRAIQISSFGGPDVLELTELPHPSPVREWWRSPSRA